MALKKHSHDVGRAFSLETYQGAPRSGSWPSFRKDRWSNPNDIIEDRFMDEQCFLQSV